MLVIGTDAAIFNINTGLWTLRPDLRTENGFASRLPFQTAGSKNYLIGGIAATIRRDEVLEFKQGKFVKKCDLSLPAQMTRIFHLRTVIIA